MSSTSEVLGKLHKMLKANIPVVPLVLHTMIVKLAYGTCVNDSSQRIGFWFYYPFMMVLCAVLEGFHASRVFEDEHPTGPTGEHRRFVVGKSILSTILFFTSTYYAGNPFTCLFTYNHVVATIMFYMSLGVMFLSVAIEHRYWTKTNGQLSNTGSYF